MKAQESKGRESKMSLGTAALNYTQNKYGEGGNRPSEKNVSKIDLERPDSFATYYVKDTLYPKQSQSRPDTFKPAK
jgi:hypothetical protein